MGLPSLFFDDAIMGALTLDVNNQESGLNPTQRVRCEDVAMLFC